MNDDKPTCGTCRHYAPLGPEPRGYCYLNPPTPVGSFCKRPDVTVKERACSHHEPGEPVPLGKTNGDTPGHAAKLAREMKRK